MKKSTLIRTHLNYNLHELERWTFWLWFCKKSSNGASAKNVRKREDINWVGSWVITLQEGLQKASSEADKRKFFEVCHDFLGKRYGFDNIVGAATSMDKVTPHAHKNPPVIYDEKKNKYRHSAKDMCSIERI